MSFTDSGDAYTGYGPGFDDLLKKREQAGPADKSEPVPGIVHGAITGILGVDSQGGNPEKAKKPGIWSPEGPGPAAALGTWMRGRGIADEPYNAFPTGLPGSKDVQQDKQLSAAPTRTDTPPNTPLNSPLPGIGGTPELPAQMPPGFQVGRDPSTGQPLGAPSPVPAPPQPAPQRVAPAPRPPVAQPSPAPVGPLQPGSAPPTSGPVAPVPSAPQADNSIIPSDSVLGRVLSGMNQWRNENRLTLLAMAGGLAGSQSWGQGLGRAFQAAVPAQQADIANNNQNQTANLLMQKMPGITQEQALAMARNPTIMQQIVPQMFGAKQKNFTVIGEDRYGNKQYGFVDPVAGTVTPISGSMPGSAAAGPDTTGLHGEEFLKTQDPTYADRVRAIARGQEHFPSGSFLRTPQGQKLADDVTKYDPDVNEQTFGARQKAFNNWTGSGQGASTYRRLNQLTEHAETTARNIDELGNYGGWGTMLNRPANALSAARGEPATQPVAESVHALADEMSALWKGTGHSSDTEIRAWEDKFPVNGSPKQQKAYLKTGLDLVHGAMNSLDTQRKNELGKAAERMPDPVPEGVRERLDRVNAWTTSGEGANRRTREIPPAPKVGDVQPDPKTGRPYRFKGGNPAKEDSWEPVK